MNKSIQNVNTVKLTLISFQPHLHSVTQVVQRGHRYTYIYPHCVYSPLLHFKKIFQVNRLSSDSLLPWQLTQSSLSLTVNLSFAHLRAAINGICSLNADHESALMFVRWCRFVGHTAAAFVQSRGGQRKGFWLQRCCRWTETTFWETSSITSESDPAAVVIKVHMWPLRALQSWVHILQQPRCHRNNRNSARLLWATSDTGLRGFVTLKSTLTGKTVRATHKTHAGVSVEDLGHPGHGSFTSHQSFSYRV